MRFFLRAFTLTLIYVAASTSAVAQQVPDVAYMFPPAAKAGTTVDVVLGGYDWTPDMDVFVHEPKMSLVVTGSPGPVIVPQPPYWFGKKARRPPFALPRETQARLTVPADLPAGIYRWQAANANGATKSGRFVVSDGAEITERRGRREPQRLPSLPSNVSGQVLKIEEVDQYRFTATKTGPITCTTIAAAIGSPLNAMVEVRDKSGRMIADAADTEGHDLSLTFAAQASMEYVVSVYDADFRGNRAFVYRLSITPGPRVVAAIPAAGRAGETRDIEFVGYGIATGAAKLESLTRSVTFPQANDSESFAYRLKTPFGDAASFQLHLSNLPETTEPIDVARKLKIPSAVTGILEQRYGSDRYFIEGKKGDVWDISLQAETIGSALDVSLVVLDAAGKELKRIDDLPGTTDAGVEFPIPVDGQYSLVISDTSGRSGNRAATYRLAIQSAKPSFTLSSPELINLPLGGKAALAIKAKRAGGLKNPISLVVEGLPAGVSVPEELVIPEGKSDLKVELTAAADAGTTAALLRISGRTKIDEREVADKLDPVLLAVTMKPPFTIDAEGKDDVTKWPRGSTFPGPVLISRDEGFNGEIVLEMHSRQGRHRQGIRGPELTIAPGVERILYPIFLPEWLETTRTSRMVVNGVAKVNDPQGKTRYLSSKIKSRIGFLPGGALLKISCKLRELEVAAGQPFEFPITISRSRELKEPAKIELKLEKSLEGLLNAEIITVAPGKADVALRITPAANSTLKGEQILTVRATVLQHGHLPVIAETRLLVVFIDSDRGSKTETP